MKKTLFIWTISICLFYLSCFAIESLETSTLWWWIATSSATDKYKVKAWTSPLSASRWNWIIDKINEIISNFNSLWSLANKSSVWSDEIVNNSIKEEDISDDFIARNSDKLDWKDSTTTLWADNTTIPTSKAVKNYVDNAFNDFVVKSREIDLSWRSGWGEFEHLYVTITPTNLYIPTNGCFKIYYTRRDDWDWPAPWTSKTFWPWNNCNVNVAVDWFNWRNNWKNIYAWNNNYYKADIEWSKISINWIELYKITKIYIRWIDRSSSVWGSYFKLYWPEAYVESFKQWLLYSACWVYWNMFWTDFLTCATWSSSYDISR